MGVIKEWRCFAHGPFEAVEAKCPQGCTAVIEREFRTPPAGRSERTKAADRALANLAARFGYTDLSNRAGSVAASQRQGKGPPELMPRWEPIPKGHVFEAGGKIIQRAGAEGGANVPIGQYHTADLIGPRIGMPAEPHATETMPLPLGELPPRPRPRVVARDNTSAEDFARAVRRAT